MAGYHIGALAVTDDKGKVIGVVSERDYLKKVALMGMHKLTRLVFNVLFSNCRKGKQRYKSE